MSQALEQNIFGVYSPQQSNMLRNSNDITWTPLQIRAVTDLDLVYVSCGFRGINVINKEGSQILYSQNFNNEYIQSFESTSNGQYIFIGISQFLFVYHLQFNNLSLSHLEMQNFYLVQNITFQTDLLNTNYNQQSELLAVAVQTGNVFLYNTTFKNQFQLLSKFSTGSNLINSLFISQDGNWLYIASDVKGVFMMSIKKQQLYEDNNNINDTSVKLIVAAHGTFGLRAQQVIVSKDNHYIYAFDFWYGFFYTNVEEVIKSQENQYPIQLSFISYWPFQDIQRACQTILINQDESLLFIGVRQHGIIILDIRNRTQIQVFEFIRLDSLIFSIALSKQEDFLYVTTSDTILTYTNDQPNLNQDLPNLFNIHQIKYQDFLNSIFKWRFYVDVTNQYLIGSFDFDGLYIFPFYNDPYKFDVNNYVSYDIQNDSVYFDKGNKYLVIPRYFSEQNIGIYQYAPLDDESDQNISFTNMKLIKNYSVSELELSEMIVFSLDARYAVQTYNVGLIIYDSMDIFNIKVLSRWNNLDFMIGQNEGACFTKDNKWIYSTIRFFGVYLLNVEDKTNPILTDYVRTNGGENVKISQSSNFIYLLDGVKGFAIIDANYAPKLQIISRIKLSGYTIDMLLLQEEKYVLITQSYRGFLTLIDINDKKYPQIVYTINYGNQFSMALCLTQTTQHLFVSTNGGMLVLPTSSQVQIHTKVNLINQNNQTGQKQIIKLDKITQEFNKYGLNLYQEYLFSVGQNIQFDFAILYPIDSNMQITRIFQYINGQSQQIPSFFQFNQFQQSVIFNVDKSLINFNSAKPNLNILLIKTVIPLNLNSFVFKPEELDGKYATNTTQSQLIYQYLCDKNIIINGILNDLYNFPPINLESQFQTELLDPSIIPENNYQQIISKITERIQLTLMKSFYINSIKFYVQTSLFFDNQNSIQFIQTNSQNTILITLSIQTSDGKLIFKSKSNIAFQLSEKQDQLAISGNLEIINKVLHNKIIFANNTQITAQISPNITLTIQDNLNYPLTEQLSIYDSQFIIIKEQLKISSDNNLQNQFNYKFQGGIVDIESDITFSFKQNTFIVSDVQDLTYQFLYLQSPNQYIQIPSNFWLLQISSNQLLFKGSTTQSMYQKSYTFKIIASDGYTKAEDTFTIKVSGIPLSYILNLLLEIFGPIIFFLSLFRKRNIFLNVIFEKTVTFSQEIAIIDEFYLKKIIILGDIQKQSKDILSQLFNQIQNLKIVEINKNQKQDRETKNKKNNFHLSYEDVFDNLQNQDDLQKQSFILLPNQNNQYPQNFAKLIQNLKKQKVHIAHSTLEKRYMDQKGNILMSVVIKDILKYKIYETNKLVDFQQDIKNTDSKIYRAIRAQIARYFLNLDQRSFLLYNYIKQICIKTQGCQNDWFKAIVDLQFQHENENNYLQRNMTTFPQLKLKYGVLLHIFQIFELVPQQFKEQIDTFDQFFQICQDYITQINIYLIREVLFADVLGFSTEEPSKFRVAIGQSLHIDQQNIKQIIALKKKKISKWLRPLFQLLNIEYSQHEIYKNMRLPSWLNLDQRNGVIILYGIPQLDDIDEYLIRIQDNTEYVILQFLLKVNQNQNKKNSQNDIDKIYGVTNEIQYKNKLPQQQNRYFNNTQNQHLKRNSLMMRLQRKSFLKNNQQIILELCQIPYQKPEKSYINKFKNCNNSIYGQEDVNSQQISQYDDRTLLGKLNDIQTSNLNTTEQLFVKNQ
ncbi:hypothetical protein TTHERM_00320370 (macronuclear) [Tetrahymena thermophila SB210]|uniref:Calpain family cysteine protease n=1 Tax=Tetrahymena thermophila (strain SB210) TaxID=312017 RepID=Q237Q0_TETTS|nr:hypothetical protein TTHERM_00320370 [Tetrahymena thermophila SB210]EAR92691.2 hypothetical protein TTHERM_00320370 [Tetrahymena thermophila SB210]|eukprot:XP_001012936.2 hypothetical protein TTHERM_00320370 [Tetrahymena thermophila SB210]